MKTKMKYGVIFLLIAAMFASLSTGIALADTAQNEPVLGASLILEDDFSSWDTAPKYTTSDEWQFDENVGVYRKTTNSQTIEYTLTEEQLEGSNGIAYVEVDLWSEGGADGHAYRVSNNILKFNVYAGATADTLATVASQAYAADGDASHIIIKTGAIENGASVISLEIEALSTNNDYALGFHGVKIYKYNASAEKQVVLQDNTANAEEERKHLPLEEGNEWLYDSKVGYYRSTAETQSFVYQAESNAPLYRGVVNFEIDAYIDSVADPQTALDVYSYYVGNAVKVNVYAGAALDSLVPVETEYTLKEGDNTHLIFKAKTDLETGMKYIKIELEKVGANNNWAIGFHSVSLIGLIGAVENVPVESVTINEGAPAELVAGGAAVSFEGTVLPANATSKTIVWKVYDDAECTIPSEIAAFRGNVLSADHDEAEAKTVYVVGEAGGVKTAVHSVSVLPHPDPESVTVTIYPTQISVGESSQLKSEVLPANANSKEVTYAVYDDESCTQVSAKAKVENGVFSALEKGEVWLIARTVVGNVSSAAVKVNIRQDVLLLDDKCDSLDYLYKDTDKELLKINQGTIMRNWEDQKLGYAAGPAYNGGEDVTKYNPGEMIYYTANEISRFEIGTIIYASTASATEGANNNPYLDFQYEIFVSADAENWTYVDTDYTVGEPTGGGVTAVDYTEFHLYNVEQLPAGIHYVKIVLVGPATVLPEDPKTDPASNFYNSTTAISQNPDVGYDKIYAFYNTFSPAINSVKLYAVEGTEIIDSLLTAKITNTETNLLKGQPLTITAELTYSSAPDQAVAWDYSFGTVEIVEGSEYVTYADGKLTLSENFNNEISEVKFKLVFADDNVESTVYTLKPVVPVESVTVSMESTEIEIEDKYFSITCTILPANATNRSSYYEFEVEGGGDYKDYVLTRGNEFKPKKAGVLLIKAICDGMESNVLRVVIKEAAAEVTIDVSAIATSVQVGGKLTLNAAVTPEGTAQTWTIKEGGEFASLERNVLTGVKEGTVKLQVTAGDKTAELTVTVTAKEDNAKAGCSGSVGTGIAALSAAALVAAAAIVLKKKKA